MSNSLYNPFLFSAFLDLRTFKDDDGGGGGGNDDGPSPAPTPTVIKTGTTLKTGTVLNSKDDPVVFTTDSSGRTTGQNQSTLPAASTTTQTNQDRINEIYASSDNPWETNGAELNALTQDRSGTFSGGSTAASSSSSSQSQPQANKSSDKNTIGSVSATGQYAGDGFEFVENEGGYLTRTYTGANEDAGLGQDVITGGTADKDTKEAIANISLNEGSSFAASPGSATDGSILDLFRDEEDKVGSGSYAEQVGQVDYTPTLTYGDAAPAVTPAVDTGIGSLRPVARPTNLLSAEEQALVDAYNAVPDSDESYTPDAATMAALLKSQNKTSAIADPLSVADQVASYGGVNLDAQDAATTAANNAAAATALGDDDFSYTILDKGQGGIGPGSALPDSSQVAGGGWEEYFQNASTQDILDLAGSNVQLPVTPDATPSYDAFGNEYATAEQAAAADLAAEAAASNYGTMSQQDFVDQYATDDAAGISDALKYAAIVGPENVGNMFSGMGRQTQITSPLNMIPTTGREVGINALIPYLTNQFGTLLMSEEDKRNRMLSADPNRPASLTSQAMQDLGGYLSGTVSPAIRDYLQPESGQAVFEGDIGGPLTVTDLSGNQLTGPQATQGIVNTTAGEVSDTALDLALNANPITRTISAALNAGEQLTGLEQGISSNVDEAYVSGALDNNATFQEALKAQGGDVDKALGVIKDLAYVSGDVPAYQQVAASGVVDAVLPKVGKGILGFGKEIAKRGAVEGGQGAFESYAAINAINQALGTDFDPTKNIVGAAATEGVAGTGAAAVGSAAAQGLSARQRRDALDEAAVMSQPVVGPYGGMDTSGITPGFTVPRQPSAPSAPQTLEGQYSVFDPNLSPTAGDPASSTVPSAYDLEGPEAGLAITDQRDPMTTSMETMAAQEIINDQVRETGAVDFGILQRIQNATGLSMSELGSMVDSATSTKLTPAEIAAIESAPVGDVMTNAPMAPGFDDEVTGNFGGSNISVRPNPDGTTTLTAPSGRISIVEPGQDLDQAIKVFDEIVTPIDVQTDAPVLKGSGQGLAAPDFTAAPFSSPSLGGISTLGTPSGVGTAPTVDTSSRTGIPKAIMTEKYVAHPSEGTVTQSAVDLVNKGPGNVSQQELLDVAEENGIVAGPGTGFLPGQVFTELSDRVSDSNLDVITSKMDADNTFEEVSDAQAVANAEAIKAQEVAYTETKAATGSDSAAEAAGEAAYDASIAASSVSDTDDGGAEVEIADNLFEAANKADQDVVTVGADGTATVAVDPNAVATGTDVAVVPETATDVTTNADGTTDVVIDGTTDLTTAATTDLTVDGDTDTDTDTTAVTVVDNTIDGTATEISGALTDQTQDQKVSVVPAVDSDISMLTEIEPPDEEVEVEVEDKVQEPGGDVTVDLDEDDTFVPVVTTTDENGDPIFECPEGYIMVEGLDGPICEKSVEIVRQRAGASTEAITGLSGNIGRVGPGQKRRTPTTIRRTRPTILSA